MRKHIAESLLAVAFRTAIAVCSLIGCTQLVRADEAKDIDEQAESEILFVRRITPLLRQKCLGCHGGDSDKIEGALDLRSLEGLNKGGDSGLAAIKPGDPSASPLYIAVTRTSDDWSAMPPKDADQLTAEQLTWLRRWIETGSVWPDAERTHSIENDYAQQWSAEDGITVTTSGGLSLDWTNRRYDPQGLWAYQPLKKPAVRHRKGDVNAIDVLIEQAMPKGLTTAPRADRTTLIRRATFDLTGLPPSPQDVASFSGDPRSDRAAFSDVVERLLRVPHYGEQMAQHWLDVVRYADSSGFANDYERGNAWRYRDYVVKSFNDDKPYDQFAREQIAGDEINPTNPACLVATGFLRMGPWELTGMEVAKIARQRFLDDVTNSVGETFLAHSLQCARCHDHKFDPVSTRDYYSIQAVFATTQLAERSAPFATNEDTHGFDEARYLVQRREEYESTITALDTILLRNAKLWLAEHQLPPNAWNAAVTQAERRSKAGSNQGGLFNAARSILTKQGLSEDHVPPKLVGFTPEEFGMERIARKGIERLNWEFDRYRPFALAVYNGHTPNLKSVNSPLRIPDDVTDGELEQSCILTGGDPFASGQNVTPGTLSVINDSVTVNIPNAMDGRRTAFATWLSDSKNPLTPRVIVNRIWQWHFGNGIAGNANNFGSTGRRPTNPELLDWLAATLIEDGWSIKQLHRYIMNSDAYCRSTQHPNHKLVMEKDPHGSNYAVFLPRRLKAEEIRDAMLTVSRELNPTIGGIPCRPQINQEIAFQPRQVMGTFASAWTPNPKPEQRNRRSLYVLKLRGLIDPMLDVFNAPSPDFSCERRESSIVTPQVFTLFNSDNSHARALALANRIMSETKSDHDAISRCFQLAFLREPTDDELNDCLTHWKDVESTLSEKADAATLVPLSLRREAVEENTGEKFLFDEKLYSNTDFVPDLEPAQVNRHIRALADVCLVLLNSNEFVYVY